MRKQLAPYPRKKSTKVNIREPEKKLAYNKRPDISQIDLPKKYEKMTLLDEVAQQASKWSLLKNFEYQVISNGLSPQ